MEKILIVDDNTNISDLLKLYVEKEGYKSAVASDGKEALEVFKREKPDLVLLDIMLPEIDGWGVCKEIRKTSDVPIIMVTAKDEVFDKVLGLELGADDYISKPFETKEVIARIRAVLRRKNLKEDDKSQLLSFDNLSINIENYELKVKNKLIEAPAKEIELVYFLAKNPNKVFTREQLLTQIWGFDYFGDSRTVDVHVKRLRGKLEGASDLWSLKTVWGVGYKFEVK